MNAYDHLLEWASEVGCGSWQAWRETSVYLGLDPSSAARNLSALGHVEFDWVGDRFCCAPSTAVLTLRSSGCLLLTGARRRGLRERLKRCWEDEDASYDVFLRPPLEQERGPATWLVEAEIHELERFCGDCELEFHVDSGRRIAEALPRATLELVGEEERPDGRFDRKWLDPRLRCFCPESTTGSDDGLWWIEENRRHVAFVRREGRWYRIPTREYGPYIAYPQQSFVTYHARLGFLSVDNAAPLPPLLARAATLQSGRLAKQDGPGRHTHVNIDPGLVELIADRLDAYVIES